ncbi:MAG: radical SAM protein [Candidatus Gastranaerophilales bacterium]|nr:radical SAM protein [Candidatus Gastranaerophilales bacterium]
MANIFLTKKCNLKCPYCFANEFVNKNQEEFSIENLIKVINFITKDGTSRIGLIGGEPTLYSKFRELIKILDKNNKVKDVIIYTNGIEIDKYINHLNPKKYSLLLNCNSPEQLGENYVKLKNNLLLLKKANLTFKLGLNLWNSNFAYIFELLKLINRNDLRFSYAIQNDKKVNNSNIIEEFKKQKSLLFDFFNACLIRNIVPSYDCNSFPDCIFTNEEKILLVKIKQLAEKYDVDSPISSCRTCNPVIDIFPDLSAIRCFGLSDFSKINISDFDNLEQLKRYYYAKIDIFAKISYVIPMCENCKMRILNKCGICFAYKLSKIKKIKNYILSEE